MISKDILGQIFNNYGINKVLLIDMENSCSFLISEMSCSLNLDRWEYLENILMDLTKKIVNIIPISQAKKYFPEDLIAKGEVIK